MAAAKLGNKIPKYVEDFVVKKSENALSIMKNRHLMKDREGNLIETPAQMFYRVASALASEDKKFAKGSIATKSKKVNETIEEFFYLMAENRFLPGSRVLYEAGNDIDGTGQLSSCFVLPLEDSLDKIFDVMKEAAIVQKNNGGTGFNFSHIRPKGDEVGGTPNVAAGPVHFIKTFSQAFDQVLQGKKRGGGNMAILNIDHPDIEEFIDLKGQDSTIRNFNISVGITDKFMEALRNDDEYELVNPRNGKAVKTLRAKEIFDKICEKAWECADPGLFFLDTTQNANPTKPLGIIEATNPCGEEPLRAYESCNLGSIVLPTHLKEVGGNLEIDWDLMRQSIRSATHFLDNMIDLSDFPLDKIKKEVESTRKLGLGVVGLGTLFFKLGIGYNSQEAVDLTEKIIAFVQEESTQESERLASERGVFPGFKGSKWDIMGRKVRNATMTSIAPTGTLSLVAETSSGVEPIFSLVYKRMSFYQDEGREDRKSLLYIDSTFEEYAKSHGFYSESLMEKIADNHGSLEGINEVPDEAKKIFVTTHDIAPEWHVKMQAAAQKDVDAAVSKTINLPNDATVDDVRKAYIDAWRMGCKGITIYRDGSKELQVLSSSKEEAKKPEVQITMKRSDHEITPNALQVLQKRALKTDDSGAFVETPADLWMRIASHIASAEETENKKVEFTQKFFDVMNQGEFFSGGTLLWAGMGRETILSKCLVLPVDDSIDSIMETLNWNIQCLRRGVGTGFNFSKIRSSYSKVKTTGEYAAGPIEYLRMFNRAQDTIKGRGGRGLGSMAILNVDHPNVEEFIECKDDLTSITHYNISVGVTDEFMHAVKNDLDWDLVDPHDGKVYKTIKARGLFEKIAKHAWVSGDPGMVFLDIMEEGNTTPNLGRMDATNPCGEQPLIPFETCNLGHINLSRFVKEFPFADDAEFSHKPTEEKLRDYIDWDRLREVIQVGVRFLDNIIDINNYPINEIEEMTKKTRNIGIGAMGFADMLVKLGVSYASEEALQIAKELMKFIQEESHKYSQALGAEKGNFPAFKGSTWDQAGQSHMRNTRVTTIAPTGTISIVANANPGIEPIFALGYRRKNSMGGTDQEVIEHLFETVAKKRGFYTPELIAEIADGKHLHEIQNKYGIPQDVVDVFVTTHEIKPEQHVRIQAVFQQYVDSAVSKTINLPNSATWQDIARVYQMAWETRCKGITIFRDGSKDPALQVGTEDKGDPTKTAAKVQVVEKVVEKIVEVPQRLEPRKRGEMAKGTTYEVKTEQGALYVTVNEDEVGIVEVFLTIGKSGSFTAGYTEAIGRLISASIRAGIDPEVIIKQLQGIRTSTPTLNKGMIVYSVPDAIAKILKKHIENNSAQMKLIEEKVEIPTVEAVKEPEVKVEEKIEEKVESKEEVDYSYQVDRSSVTVEEVTQTVTETVSAQYETQTVNEQPQEDDAASKYTKSNTFGDMLECPDCGADLEYAEGCILCRSCGYSKCG